MDIVKSSLEQQVAVHVVEQNKIAEAKALVNAKVAFAKRQLTGKLTFAEFKTLKGAAKIGYVNAFGRPKTDDQLLGAANKKAKSKLRKKIAKRSRARNR